jgi:hypothetical protein
VVPAAFSIYFERAASPSRALRSSLPYWPLPLIAGFRSKYACVTTRSEVSVPAELWHRRER